MRVLLVRPPVPRQTMGLKHIMVCEPLELEYVAAGLGGHEVQIQDLILEKGLQERLATFRPQVVATGSYINGVNEAIRVCRIAKRWNPEVWTVVGGVHASRAPEDFSDEAVDVIALGDGTTLMPDLLQAIDEGRMLEEVPGLALPLDVAHPDATSLEGPPPGPISVEGAPRNALSAQGHDVERGRGVFLTPPRKYMPHPDTLPFPRRDLTAHLRKRYFYLTHRPLALMKTTWGCWYRCNFCFNWQITDGEAFLRSPESIVAELSTIEEEDIYIVDDIFLAARARLRRIADLIRKAGLRKNFLCFGRADFIARNEDLVAEWANLGLKAVLVGLEATSDAELQSMRKGSSVDHNRAAIEVLRRHGVDPYASLIPMPSYGPEEWDRLWTFIEENDLYYLNISPLTPLPGTDIWEEHAQALTVPRSAHGLWDLSHSVLPTRQPLKEFYRSLLGVYSRAIMNPSRARRLARQTGVSLWSPDFLRTWAGAVRIWLQFRRAHRHHQPQALAKAMERGPSIPLSPRRLRLSGSRRSNPSGEDQRRRRLPTVPSPSREE